MCPIRKLPWRTALLCLTFALGATAGARAATLPPSALHKVVELDQVTVHHLDRIFPDVLLADDAAKAATENMPQRFALPADVAITPGGDGTWELLGDGGRLWRLRIDAPGATDLNFGFRRFRLPPGATLHIASEDHDSVRGPYTAADNRDHGELWTPVVAGSRTVIELYVPPGAEFEPELELGRVGRGYRDWFGLARRDSKQGSCNIDVACPEADLWRNEVQSVAVYSVAGFLTCTGSLVMDVPRSATPYFLTAYHCGVSEANDQTVVTYWNFESPECGELNGGSLAQTVSGSTFVARRQDSDFCLLELDETPPAQFNAFWSGWDRRLDHIPQGSVCIHHPDTDEKAISLNDDPLTVVGNCILTNPPDLTTHWRLDNWEQGTTEPGSSGSGLWDSGTGLLVGTLSGGTASCGNPSGFDCFGRFAVGWDGPTPDSRLRDWLDPAGTGAETVTGAFFGGGGGGGGTAYSCGNAGYDDNTPESAAYFEGGGNAGNPDFMYAVRFGLADLGYQPGNVRMTGFCASNQLAFEGGPWSNEVFVYPDDGGTPDDGVVLAQGTITTGDGTGDEVISLPQPVILDDDFWIVVRGDPKHAGEDFNVEFDAGPNTGHSYFSSTGIDDLDNDNGPEDYPDGVNYMLRASLEPLSAGAAHRYIAGAIARTGGTRKTSWRSKFALLNRSGLAATVSLSYIRATKTASTTIKLANGELRVWNDVVLDLFGVSEKSSGAVIVESDRPLIVTARTYNQLEQGTVGQFYPGISTADTLVQGRSGAISQLVNNAAFRTNIGFVNLGTSSCQVRLRLFSDFGAQVGATRTLTLPPLGWLQDNDSFGAAGAGTQDDAYATVEVLGSACKVWGYGAVIDNTTGDPTTIPIVAN